MEGGALAAIFEFRVAGGRRVVLELPGCLFCRLWLRRENAWMHQKQEMVSVPWTLGRWVDGSDTAAALLQGGAGCPTCVQQFEVDYGSGDFNPGAFELCTMLAESGFQSSPVPSLRSCFLPSF